MRILRRVIIFLIAAAFLSAAVTTVSASGRIDSRETCLDVFAAYREQQTKAFEVSLTGSFFDSLAANDFQELSVLFVEVGITDYHMQYTTAGDLFLQDVMWTEPHATECATEQQFRKSLESNIEEGLPSFQFIIRDKGLYDLLVGQKRLFTYAAMCGMESLQLRSTANEPYVLWVDDLQPFTVPWYTVCSREDWILGIESMAMRNASRFSLILEPTFAALLENDEELLKQMEACSSMAEWKKSFSDDLSRFDYSDVVFTSEPRVYCEAENAVMETIRQMGISGIDSFRLILSRNLFETLSGNEFAKLLELQADAGMSSSDLQYDPDHHLLIYSNAVIHSNTTKLTAAEEACTFLADAVADGETQIPLFCTPELYTYLIGDISADNGFNEQYLPLSDAVIQAGISKYSYTCSQASRLITVTVNDLYPGTKIVNAIKRNDDSSLTEREKEAKTAALRLSEQCRADNPLTTARQVHDALCSMTVYTIDESTDEDDNALGVLLNGQANCDGYADAFFLVGSLAGLEVRYQHGDSYEKDPNEKYKDVTHLWNLIRLSGTWRLVDVTWDDREDEPVYTWFNIGADRARQMHIWNEDMSIPLLAETDLSERPGNEYLIPDRASAGNSAAEAFRNGYRSCTLVFENLSIGKEDAANIVEKALNKSFSYEWNEYMQTMTVFFDIP